LIFFVPFFFFFFDSIYGCCCAFAALSINENSSDPSPAPFYAYVGGIVPVMIIAYLINWPRSRKLTLPNASFQDLLISEDTKLK